MPSAAVLRAAIAGVLVGAVLGVFILSPGFQTPAEPPILREASPEFDTQREQASPPPAAHAERQADAPGQQFKPAGQPMQPPAQPTQPPAQPTQPPAQPAQPPAPAKEEPSPQQGGQQECAEHIRKLQSRELTPLAVMNRDFGDNECVLDDLPCPPNMKELVDKAVVALAEVAQVVAGDDRNWVNRVEGGSACMEIGLRLLVQLVNLGWVNNYCESGFNAGYSVIIALATNPDVKVTSLGMMGMWKAESFASAIEAKYPGRLTVVRGDLYKTIPEHAGKMTCDIVFADAHAKASGHKTSYVTDELALWRQHVIRDRCHLGMYECRTQYVKYESPQWEAVCKANPYFTMLRYAGNKQRSRVYTKVKPNPPPTTARIWTFYDASGGKQPAPACSSLNLN